MTKSGLAFHCHHAILFELVYDYDKRVDYIKTNKPASEQELRLRLFKFIPEDRIPGKDSLAWEACDKARVACDKARVAYDKAWEACDKARVAYSKARVACDKAWEAYNKAQVAYDKAWEAYNKAQVAYDKARVAYDKAWEAYNKAYEEDIRRLHTELCPDCPWNGETIFPE